MHLENLEWLYSAHGPVEIFQQSLLSFGALMFARLSYDYCEDFNHCIVLSRNESWPKAKDLKR